MTRREKRKVDHALELLRQHHRTMERLIRKLQKAARPAKKPRAA
jgi:hypothetical protein